MVQANVPVEKDAAARPRCRSDARNQDLQAHALSRKRSPRCGRCCRRWSGTTARSLSSTQPSISTRRSLAGGAQRVPIWVRSTKHHPSVRYGDRNWHFWQYQSDGSVPGIGTAVDRNVFRGDEKEWQRWLASN